MAVFNRNGQWSLTGNEENLLFKTGGRKSSGVEALPERRSIDTSSEEAEQYFAQLAKSALIGSKQSGLRQATDEELFDHLVVSEEQVQKAEQDWNNQINDFYTEATKPLEKQDSKENLDWGNGRSFNDSLTPEELAKRNRHIG
jgi:hypothetical protein